MKMQPSTLAMTATWVTLLSWPAAFGAEARTWTTRTGSTLQAELDVFADSMATLRTADQRTLRIAYDKLCAEDQAYLRKHLPDPQFSIQHIRLAGWERQPVNGDTAAVFEVRIVHQNHGGLFKNPDLKLAFRMDTSERYIAQEKKKVYDPNRKKKRTILVEKHETKSGTVSGNIETGIWTDTDAVVDTANKASVIEHRLVSKLVRQDKTSYRLTSVNVKIMLDGRVLAEYTGP